MTRSRARRWRGGRGRGSSDGFTLFSLLELIVASVITLVALWLASGLLLESQARMAHSARQALDPVGEIAAAQIRADLRAAATVSSGSGDWSREPMTLVGHPAGRLTYEKTGNELRRITRDGERPVLRSVSTFRWRWYGGSIEVDLGYRVTRGWGLLAAGGTRELPIPEETRILLRVTPRSGGSSQW